MGADGNSLTLAAEGYTRDLKVGCLPVFRGEALPCRADSASGRRWVGGLLMAFT